MTCLWRGQGPMVKTNAASRSVSELRVTGVMPRPRHWVREPIWWSWYLSIFPLGSKALVRALLSRYYAISSELTSNQGPMQQTRDNSSRKQRCGWVGNIRHCNVWNVWCKRVLNKTKVVWIYTLRYLYDEILNEQTKRANIPQDTRETQIYRYPRRSEAYSDLRSYIRLLRRIVREGALAWDDMV